MSMLDGRKIPSATMSETLLLPSHTTLTLNQGLVFRYLEYGSASPSKLVLKKLNQLIPRARELAQPQVLSRICRVGEAADLHKDDLPKPIQCAELLAFGLCTVGSIIEEEAKRLHDNGEWLDWMILNALGAAAVSELCERLGYRIFDWAAAQGLNASRGFEPGSGVGHWPLERQRIVFANLPAEEIGVVLGPQLSMWPTKTLSFLMGVGARISQGNHPFSCQGCKRIDCAYHYEPAEPSIAENTEESIGPAVE